MNEKLKSLVDDISTGNMSDARIKVFDILNQKATEKIETMKITKSKTIFNSGE